jgi:hypothetical protein
MTTRAKAVPKKRVAKKRNPEGEGVQSKLNDQPLTSVDEDRSASAEAHTLMGQWSSKVVASLMDQMAKGDRKSAQLLVELAKTEAAAKEALEHGPLRSQALLWAAEPPWEGDWPGETEYPGGGGPEPE